MPDRQEPAAQSHRYEAKYLVTEWQAAQIRRHCRDYLPLDPHASHRPGFEYPVLSLYLDSPARALLRHTLHKRVHRYKLRVRTYRKPHESWTDLPAFVEIKRRLNGVVNKTRARVGPEAAEPLLWADYAPIHGPGVYDRATQAKINAFLQLRNQIRAFPVVGTFYMREAYEGNSAERTRITLDRNLHYGLSVPSSNGNGETWWPVNPGGVVLEVKFTNTYPFWVANMLRRLEILRRGVCKYVICARAAGVSPESRLPQAPLTIPQNVRPIHRTAPAGRVIVGPQRLTDGERTSALAPRHVDEGANR